MDHQYEEYRQVVQSFSQGLLRAGKGLALAPISMLPQESRQHLKEAGQDFTHGLTQLAHTLANSLEKMGK